MPDIRVFYSLAGQSRVSTARLALALVVLVSLSGCASAPIDPMGNEPDAPNTADGHPENPYGKDTLTVGLDTSAAERNVTPLVANALAYWEENASEYAGYPIDYTLEPDATNPDVQIDWRENITACDSFDTRTIGCADLVTDRAPATTEIAIEAGWTNSSTEDTLIHELGHTLGLDHDDEPQPIMQATGSVTPAEQRPEVTLLLDQEYHDHETAREQTERALEYWDEWADGNLEQTVSYDLQTTEIDTDSESRGTTHSSRSDSVDADRPENVSIAVADDREYCDANESTSCTGVSEPEIDTDDYSVGLATPRADTIGWFVGYYLGAFHGLESDEYPEPFQTQTIEHVSGEWWADE